MAKRPASMLDGVAEETISEMATSFFGARKEVESLLERIEVLTKDLEPLAERVREYARALNGLLPPGKVTAVYRAVGVESEAFVNVPEGPAAEVPKGGFAFSGAGRFAERGLTAYQTLHHALDLYQHGEYLPDPDAPEGSQGRKTLTPNLTTLKRLVLATNQRIDDVNQAPSHVLGYLRKLDVAETVKEKTTGATIGDYADAVDANMAYTPVDLGALGLPEWPDLPPLADVRKLLTKVLKDLYRKTS
ncbi:MAG: hypothetical protein F6K39_01925 [Okeania sp. SIO3B3]|nr:hypothetical protein [Okeania sp. SIO3B3]